MLDNLPIPKPTENSLTFDEQMEVLAATKAIAGNWCVDFEEGPDGDLYARLVPPWSDGDLSAFLLERQNLLIVLTDRLSSVTQDIVHTFSTVTEALQSMLTTACGNTTPPTT